MCFVSVINILVLLVFELLISSFNKKKLESIQLFILYMELSWKNTFDGDPFAIYLNLVVVLVF